MAEQEIRKVDEETAKQIRFKAGEFTLSLVKVLLQTGYYSTDHPLARTVSKELYEKFRELADGCSEMSYVLMSTLDEQGIQVESLLPEPIDLSKAFRGIMGDHFLGKFQDYFQRNRIASFTIKERIDPTEFETFLGVWVGWSVRTTADKSFTADLSAELARQGIINVTVVGLDEVIGAMRHLPWPVKVAMSRLRKDLSQLPILKAARAETLAKLKAQVVGDIIRPIYRPEMVRDLLLNADLIGDGLKEITLLELEDAIIASVSEKLALNTALLLLDILEQAKLKGLPVAQAGRNEEEFTDCCRTVTTKMLVKLAAGDFEDARSLLETSYQRGLISMEILPEKVRRHIKAVQLTDKFITSPETYLKDLLNCTDPRQYLTYLHVLSLVLPELASRGEPKYIGLAFAVFYRHVKDPNPSFAQRKSFIEDTLKQLGAHGILDDLIRMAVTLGKGEREGLEVGIALFGTHGVPTLLKALNDSEEDLSKRKAICNIFLRIGEPCAEQLTDELRAHRMPWFATKAVMSVLADIGYKDAARTIESYTGHPHAKVREECILSLVKLLGPAAARILLMMLDDKDDGNVRKVIQNLGAIHCVDKSFLNKIRDTVRLRTRKETEPHDWLQVACLRALSHYQGVALPEGTPDFEPLLIENLRPSPFKRLLPGKWGIRRKSEDVIKMCADALATLGTAKSLAALRIHEQSEFEATRRSVADAIAAIEAREAAKKA